MKNVDEFLLVQYFILLCHESGFQKKEMQQILSKNCKTMDVSLNFILNLEDVKIGKLSSKMKRVYRFFYSINIHLDSLQIDSIKNIIKNEFPKGVFKKKENKILFHKTALYINSGLSLKEALKHANPVSAFLFLSKKDFVKDMIFLTKEKELKNVFEIIYCLSYEGPGNVAEFLNLVAGPEKMF